MLLFGAETDDWETKRRKKGRWEEKSIRWMVGWSMSSVGPPPLPHQLFAFFAFQTSPFLWVGLPELHTHTCILPFFNRLLLLCCLCWCTPLQNASMCVCVQLYIFLKKNYISNYIQLNLKRFRETHSSRIFIFCNVECCFFTLQKGVIDAEKNIYMKTGLFFVLLLPPYFW